MDFDEQIRAMLAVRGVKARVARESGMPRSVVARIASGRPTTAERWKAIAGVLGCRVVLSVDRPDKLPR